MISNLQIFSGGFFWSKKFFAFLENPTRFHSNLFFLFSKVGLKIKFLTKEKKGFYLQSGLNRRVFFCQTFPNIKY
jgi:hypothetical protein